MWRLYLSLALCLLWATSPASASFINGGFESEDLSGWSALGSANVSTGHDFGGGNVVAPYSGSFSARLMSGPVFASDLVAQMAIDAPTLDASNDGVNAVSGSLIWQSVYLNAGDVLEFRWNFVAMDYAPYDDWAFFGIQYGSNATQLTRLASTVTLGAEANVRKVSGWSTSTATIQQSGNYTFYFGAVNATDNGYPSELWLDSAGITPIPEPSTLILLIPALAALALRKRQAKTSA